MLMAFTAMRSFARLVSADYNPVYITPEQRCLSQTSYVHVMQRIKETTTNAIAGLNSPLRKGLICQRKHGRRLLHLLQ